jgi:hypothetical protein
MRFLKLSPVYGKTDMSQLMQLCGNHDSIDAIKETRETGTVHVTV